MIPFMFTELSGGYAISGPSSRGGDGGVGGGEGDDADDGRSRRRDVNWRSVLGEGCATEQIWSIGRVWGG